MRNIFKCICFYAIMGIVCSASMPYLPRPVNQGRYAAAATSSPVTSQKAFYFYSAPSTTNVEESRTRRTYQSNSVTGNTIKRQQQQQQQQVIYVKTPETASSRIVAYQQRQLQQPQPQQLQHQYHQQLQYQHQARYHQVKPDVHFVKYHTAEEVSNALVQQYGGGGGGSGGVKTVEAASSIQPKIATSTTLLPSHVAASHSYLVPAPIVELSKSPLTAASSSASTIALPPTPPNTPVHKNYAQNFLPDGEDVIPGSSYIPLVLKAR